MRRLIAILALSLAATVVTPVSTEAAPRPWLTGQQRIDLCNWIRPYGIGALVRVVQWVPDRIACWVLWGGGGPCVRYYSDFEDGQWSGARYVTEVPYDECRR